MITVFLSHASEDKDDFVRPLAELLRTDFNVWYDEYELTLGDSLLRKIDDGLKNCDYGIVVLSPSFFSKRWPQRELDGLFALETTERKVILPIWKDVKEDEVRDFSPILATRVGVSTDRGIEQVVHEIKRAVGLVDRYKGLEASAWKSKFAALNADIAHKKAAEALSRTNEGVEIVFVAAHDIIAAARARAEDLIKNVNAFGLRIIEGTKKNDPNFVGVGGPKRLCLTFSFSSQYTNSVDHSRLSIRIIRERDYFDDPNSISCISVIDLMPQFDHEFKVYWQYGDRIFSTGNAVLDFGFEIFADKLREEFSH